MDMRRAARRSAIPAALFLSLVVLFVSCQTVPKSIPTTLTESEYFQKGQDAASNGNYRAALMYYDTFEKRFPNDQARMVEAKYEVAFIAYKKGDLKQARTLFQNLADEYKKSGSDTLPRWPLVLSNKLILIIDTDLKKK
jgi:outer membrane protein assembly factor BamD (BamD/ComL family)